MSDQDPSSELPGGLEATAAEYVLGFLTPEEVEQFEALLAHDSDLRQDVAAWAEYLSTMTDQISGVSPPAAVIKRIEMAAFGAPPAPIWRQVVPYLVGAVGGAAIAWVVFAFGLTDSTQPELRADLTAEGSQLALTARFDPASAVLVVDLASGDLPEGRALHLWLITDTSAAPVSLGVLSESGGIVLALPRLLAERLPGATLSVTSEAEDGADISAPSDQVVAQGQLSQP